MRLWGSISLNTKTKSQSLPVAARGPLCLPLNGALQWPPCISCESPRGDTDGTPAFQTDLPPVQTRSREAGLQSSCTIRDQLPSPAWLLSGLEGWRWWPGASQRHWALPGDSGSGRDDAQVSEQGPGLLAGQGDGWGIQRRLRMHTGCSHIAPKVQDGSR